MAAGVQFVATGTYGSHGYVLGNDAAKELRNFVSDKSNNKDVKKSVSKFYFGFLGSF
jgi:hypothetical protein